MAPYSVREGLEVEFDFSTITIAEWRSLFGNKTSAEDDDAIVSRITGIDAPTLSKLLLRDYQRLFNAIVAAAKQTDPS